MLHAQLRRISPRARSSLSWAGSPKRTFGSYNSGEALARVPVLRPTLWALGAISTIYFGCAAYDVCRDVWDAKRQGAFSEGRVGTYEELEYTKLRSDGRHFASRTSSSSSSRSSSSKWLPTGQLGEMFAKFNESEKLILGVSALNIGLTGASYFAPGSFMQHFSHIPVYSPNYTLLTSAFGHSGLLHVALNTFMLIQLAPNVAQSHVFQANGSHLAAFYLSAGILSSLGDHLATLLPTRKYRYNRFAASLGSSGVAFAMIGAFAMLHPDAQMGIMFLPGSYSMESFIVGLALFDAFGLFVGIPFLRFAHGAHLAGLAVGSAYVYYDGEKHIWRPTRRFAFHSMKRLRMI